MEAPDAAARESPHQEPAAPDDGELAPKEIHRLFDEARLLLEGNTQAHMLDGESHVFSVPARDRYPFQWFWDSCFHAIAWLHFDVERARQEIRSLLAAQRDDGLIPHVVYWDRSRLKLLPFSIHWTETRGRFSFLPFSNKPRTSELIQPPVIAEAVQRICDATPKDRSFLHETVPSLNAHFRWLRDCRDPDGDHLITIVAPYESGIDACPAYDEVIGYRRGRSLPFAVKRYAVLLANAVFHDYDQHRILERGAFHVEDVLVNSLYALNLGILADLNARAGNPRLASDWERESAAVTRALIDKCWDPARGAFFNLNDRKERRSAVLTLGSLMPLVLPGLPASIAGRLADHLLDAAEFALPWPVPSVPRSEPSFSADSRVLGEGYEGLWRGPSWVNTNWYLCRGLRAHGHAALAATIEAKTCLAVSKGGFREYFNPLTGAGGGAPGFGWSTLVVDLEYFVGRRGAIQESPASRVAMNGPEATTECVSD